MTQELPEDTPPEKLGRVFLLGVQEMLGRDALEQLIASARLESHINEYKGNNLNLKFSSAALGGILNAIEDIYGSRAGQGLILRAGEAGFKYGLREFGPELGLTDLAFRLLPFNKRIAFLMHALTDLADRIYPASVRVVEEDQRFLWQVGRYAAEPDSLVPGQLCCLLAGFFREAMYWVSGGKPTMVESIPVGTETATICTIAVYKKTLK
jgi:hypothetical protein